LDRQDPPGAAAWGAMAPEHAGVAGVGPLLSRGRCWTACAARGNAYLPLCHCGVRPPVRILSMFESLAVPVPEEEGPGAVLWCAEGTKHTQLREAANTNRSP